MFKRKNQLELSTQASPVYFQTIKAATIVAYASLLVVTWNFFDRELHWEVSLGAVSLSGLWLILTRLKLNQLLSTYFDVLSRLEIVIPTTLGILLATGPLFITHSIWIKAIAVLELLSWFFICLMYRKNRQLFVVQGHGPVPAGCWISPPPDVLEPGDLLLTSGRVATHLRESVGHAEMVIRIPTGEMKAFSSYMARGLVLNPLGEVASESFKHGHYIVLRPKHPWTPDEQARSAQIAQDMLAENLAWREEVNGRRRHIINQLPIPLRLKKRLIERFKATGYDWLGLFMGRLAKRHWTCIGACLELYKRLGVRTGRYGTGVFGLGTGLLDPIMPVRLLSDATFHLLKNDDEVTVDYQPSAPSPVRSD